MDTRIKASDYQITPEVATYLDDRLASLEKLLGDTSLVRCEVELGRDAGRPRHGANIWFAEMRLISPGNSSIYARNNSESVNGAIDDVKEEMERQLLSERKLHRRIMRRTGSAIKSWIRFGGE